jgi:hypothetical protein
VDYSSSDRNKSPKLVVVIINYTHNQMLVADFEAVCEAHPDPIPNRVPPLLKKSLRFTRHAPPRNGILDLGNAVFGPIEVDRSRNGVAENWKNILKRRGHLSVNTPQSAVLVRKLCRVYDHSVEIGIKVRAG